MWRPTSFFSKLGWLRLGLSPRRGQAMAQSSSVGDSAGQPPASSPELPGLEGGGRRVMAVGWTAIILLTLAMLGLLVRVAQLQSNPPQPISELVGSQHTAVTLYDRRGQVLDRNGRTLSASEPVRRLYVDPKMIENPGEFAEKVGYALGYDPAELERKIHAKRDSRFVVVDPELTDDRFRKVQAMKSSALGVEVRQRRDYPMGHLAGQVLGFVGFEGRGLEGVEKAFNASMTGDSGQMVYLRDATRRPIWLDAARFERPQDGHAVRLSIDSTIQSIVEKELDDACRKYAAWSGQVVVMNPYTGEVLAMANWPLFDPNELSGSTADLRRNRCITDFFEPGSIYKPFVWSAATQMGLAKPTEMIDCTSGLWVTAAGRRLHDAHGSGMQTWEGVLIKSSNIGMGKVGERMGAIRMYRAVRAFGFGEPTGIELQGESGGMVNQLKRWSGYSITSLPMGQEVGTTPLQIVRGYSVFANGGLLVKPTLRAVENPMTLNGKQVIGRVLTPEVAYETRQVMARVVTEGTGKMAKSSYYTIFGKTGTAQMADHGRGGYLPGGYVASFVGGAPVEYPQLIVGCFIQHPDPSKGHYGGIVSAPSVKRILEQSLMYLGIAPDIAASSDRDASPVDARE